MKLYKVELWHRDKISSELEISYTYVISGNPSEAEEKARKVQQEEGLDSVTYLESIRLVAPRDMLQLVV